MKINMPLTNKSSSRILAGAVRPVSQKLFSELLSGFASGLMRIEPWRRMKCTVFASTNRFNNPYWEVGSFRILYSDGMSGDGLATQNGLQRQCRELQKSTLLAGEVGFDSLKLTLHNDGSFNLHLVYPTTSKETKPQTRRLKGHVPLDLEFDINAPVVPYEGPRTLKEWDAQERDEEAKEQQNKTPAYLRHGLTPKLRFERYKYQMRQLELKMKKSYDQLMAMPERSEHPVQAKFPTYKFQWFRRKGARGGVEIVFEAQAWHKSKRVEFTAPSFEMMRTGRVHWGDASQKNWRDLKLPSLLKKLSKG